MISALKLPVCMELQFKGNGWYMPQLKIVLLGGRNSGKSSIGNLLLGKEEFVTKERTCCCRRMGFSGSHWLTVVDTPGWWCDLTPQDTSELVKREIVTSVTLCNPGPHVFIIVVKANSIFTEQRRKAVEEHVQLLGGAVWKHCFLVLVFTDSWRLTEAEVHIQRSGKQLQWIYDKCAQRCHSLVVNDGTQIPELMQKIQKMVVANGNTVFEMPEDMLQKVTEEKRGIEERARSRFKRMKKQRAMQREKLRSMTDIKIVLLGAKGSGKSSVFHTILGNNQDKTRTVQTHVGQAFVFGRQVTVVDTPGWWCNYFSEETSIFDKREMVLSLSLCPPGPHVFLLIIRVDRSFTDTYRKAVEDHIGLISDQIWNRVIVLFSFGDWLGGTTTEYYIENEGKPLRWIVEKCNNRYHVFNNKTKGDGFQVRELMGKIEEMVSACGSNWHFEIENSVMIKLEQEMREGTERAETRRMLKERQRETARANLDKFPPLSELKLVLLGGCKTGKSSCGNTILSQDCFKTQTQTSSFNENQVHGKRVTVLDTPGSFCVNYDLFKTSSAFLLVVNVSSAFKKVHLKSIEDQIEEVEPQIWEKTIVLFSFGDCLGDTTIEQHIESEGQPLQKIVNKCGNRYHVLNNKKACTKQVNDMIGLIEEMTVKERLKMFENGDQMTRRILQKQPHLEAKAVCELHLSDDSAGSSTIKTSESPGLIVPHGSSSELENIQDRSNFQCCITTLPNGKRLSLTEAGQKLVFKIPVWLFGEDTPTNMRLHCETSGHSAIVLFLPHSQSRRNEMTNPARSLCQPMLIDRTLERLTKHGSLQNIIDQWGDSSLQELEAFIDLYFEMVWEQVMGSHIEESSQREEEETEDDVLTNINQKLSKLDVLEEIKEDLTELKKAILELKKKL
ncbi:GTPase IMAP family member 8-like isoform X2 [Boleophthalmus pectinirostris]|uniref:GTPase IMAP family member 8-like isoform X2 n=1 Tax=Boleophthalmus pectinirostris TaxID=150288 RepID=UPI00242C6D79|nr:GTPase IMAP family member 8-like isoform X2 [Boleophthalmus pectinirostris]